MNFRRILKEIGNTYFVLRLKEINFRYEHKKRFIRLVNGMDRFKRCDYKKPKSQIKKEMRLMKNFWGCYPFHYYQYDLYRKDKELSERELINYIPAFFFYSLFLPFYDSEKYAILLKDKIITEQLFKSLSIPQPPTICKLINNQIYNQEFAKKNFQAIGQELAEKKYKKIFVKPTDGKGGYGIYVFNRNNRGQYVNRDNDLFNEDFLNEIGTKNDYIIQPGVEQILEMSRIYSHSLNTLRIATENKDGHVRILCATLRTGRGGKQVDNGSQGGIFIKIDVKTGQMSHYATSHQMTYLDKHPDTNFVFKAHKISNWDKLREFTIKSAKKMPHFTYLAWDIAFTKNGFSVIETNLSMGIDIFQVAIGGLREIFKINEPKFYWKNKGKRA